MIFCQFASCSKMRQPISKSGVVGTVHLNCPLPLLMVKIMARYSCMTLS